MDAVLLARIGEAAERAGLGRHMVGYPAGRSYFERDAVRAGIFTVLALGWTGFSAATGSKYLMFAGLLTVALAVATLIVGVASLRYLGGNRGVRLDLFEGGLVVARKDGMHVVRYAETTVRQKIVHYLRSGRKFYTYWVTDIGGATVVLRENFADPQQWGSALQKAVTDAQLPKVSAELDAGRRVEFGPMWVSASEIGSGRTSVPWSQIERIVFGPELVRVDVEGKLLGTPGAVTSKVPNIYLFHTVADRLCSIHGRPGAVTQ